MKDNENVGIYIVTHKNFDTERTNPAYKVLCCEDEDITSDKLEVVKVPRMLANDGWSEWAKIYPLYRYPDRYGLKDWVGLNHYHRFFGFAEEINFIPDVDEFVGDALCVTLPPLGVESIRGQYAFCHNVEDYDLCMDIAKNLFPDYADAIDKTAKLRQLIASNIILLRKDTFLNLCSFVFTTLFEWCRTVGINPESDDDFHKRVEDNIDSYTKMHNSKDYKYFQQARIPAFLSERLVTAWMVKHALDGEKIIFVDMAEK